MPASVFFELLFEKMSEVAAVKRITPITTKNPKNTIRNAISQSQMIVSTGDGRYRWKPRLINNSIIRHTIQAAELVDNRLYWDDDVKDALCPTFFASQQYRDRSPINVTLPDGIITTFTLKMFSADIWGTQADANFWKWFHDINAQPGDHLLFKVVDGEMKQYEVIYQRRKERDEETITERNQAFVGKVSMNDQELDEIRRRMQESLIEAKREDLCEQYGMQLDNLDSSLLSPEAKNEWLDYVLEFERQFENAKTITVRERIGNPTIRPVEEIPQSELEATVNELLELLYENAIAAGFLGEWDDLSA
jgi:hypothetical protein